MKDILILRQLKEVEKLQKAIAVQQKSVEEALVDSEEMLSAIREDYDKLHAATLIIAQKISGLEDAAGGQNNVSPALEAAVKAVAARAVVIDAKVDDL